MRTPGWRVAAALVLLPTLLAVGVASADPGPSTPSAPEAADRWGGRGLEGPILPRDDKNQFLGQDGQLHDSAGWTVRGRRGTVYLGEEFDSACYHGGTKLEQAMGRLARFARLIENSGRRVVFTVPPGKSAVNKRDLPRRLPHGACDADGLAAQDRVLDTFTDRNYLPMRSRLKALADRRAQAYWDLDSHWTTVGSTRWGQSLAKALDPRVARLQRYRAGTRTHVPDIAFLIGQQDVYETAPARLTKTRVRVSPARGSVAYDVETLTGYDLSWQTSPVSRTWPGRTLLLGDSFTYVGMESLMPLFQHGRFMWIGHTGTDAMIQAVIESDTVVVEVVQRYVPSSLVTKPATQLQLALALTTAGLGIRH